MRKENKKNLNTKEYWDNFFKEDRFQKKHSWRVGPYHRAVEALNEAGLGIDNCTVLDVGCAFGDGLQYLDSKYKNLKLIGFDYSEEAIIWAAQKYKDNKNYSFYVDDIYNMKEVNVDIIIIAETLEHLENDNQVLEKLKRQCRILIVTVPNNEIKNNKDLHKMHVNSYTKDSFKGAFVTTGEADDYLVAIYINNKKNDDSYLESERILI